MMGRLLFYSNKKDKIERFIRLLPKLLKEYEVALSTDDYHLQRALAIGKYLVVNPITYDYDILVTNNKAVATDNSLTLEELEGLL